MKKVFLGVGYGGSDSGAVSYLVEKDVNLNMALACRYYLEANGVEVRVSRTSDENDTLNEEIRECNAYEPDLAVDIHNNAGGGDGFETYHHHLGGNSVKLARNIEDEVIAIGQNSRGCKTRMNSKGNADYYGFIRDTKASAVIDEGVFVDNAEDVKIADTVEKQKAFGVAIAKGILKTLNVESRNESTNTNEVKVFSRTTYIRNEPSLNSSEKFTYKANTAVEILKPNVAQSDGHNWDYVRVVVNNRYGYVANDNGRYK